MQRSASSEASSEASSDMRGVGDVRAVSVVRVLGAAIAVAITSAALGTASAAPPQVEIHAQTKLVLEKVRLVADDVAEVRGALLDNLTGDGIEHQTVTIRIGGETATVPTDPEGKFHATLTVSPGGQTVELGFHGTAFLTAAELHQTTDPARAQVGLTIDFEDAPSGVSVIVRATADDQPAQLTVALSAGAAQGPLTSLATIQTGARFALTRKAAGGPGNRRVRAEFAGDSARQPAATEKTIVLNASSTTTMAVSASQLAYEDNVEITGKVTDEDGHAISRAALTLASGDHRLAQGATTDDGSYKFKLEGEVLGHGQWGLQVQADPGKPSIKPSRSEPVIIRVSAPQPVPVSYTIAAFLLTACAAGGFFTARARPWRRLVRPAPPAEAAVHAPHDEPVAGGLVAAKPGLVSTLRRPSDDSFSGAVRDTVRGRPVADAVVRLRLHDDLREVRTSADGNFAFEALTLGDWLAEVSAPGHLTETFVVSVPHRGELRGVRVDLVPVRERVFQLYRRAAEPILPEPRLWGVWSPRQIIDHVKARRPSPALADLTSFVEEVYFSSRLADETVLPDASDHVDRAIRERARAAS